MRSNVLELLQVVAALRTCEVPPLSAVSSPYAYAKPRALFHMASVHVCAFHVRGVHVNAVQDLSNVLESVTPTVEVQIPLFKKHL